MKLLFLPPAPMLTKKGKPRKRNRFMQPGRLFFEDGRELQGVSSFSIQGGTPAEAATLHIEIYDPEVELIKEPPAVREPKRRV